MQTTLKLPGIGAIRRRSYFFALLLLVIAVAATYQIQPSFFTPATRSASPLRCSCQRV